MSDFLLELASEEIPARMQSAAAEQLSKRLTEGLQAAGLAHGTITADATPRRLWLIAENLGSASTASTEERRGPRADAPPAAIEGFLRSTNLPREALEERQTPKGTFLYARITSEGRPAAAILATLIPQIIRDFAWPKSMRWGAASATTASPRWVRPLTGIVALLDGEIIPLEAHGITSGRTTRGHRIHAPDPIEIQSAETYAAQLRAAKVIISSAKRRQIIAKGAETAAHPLKIIHDEALTAENAGLTEWPIPLAGHFDPQFLEVPREIIQLTMRTNQKYFACTDATGALAPAFVAIANLEATDGGAAIIAGNQRVLAARLADAKFFWDQDVATVKAGGLEAFLPKLETITFHEKLGSVADKVARVAKLARWLVESGAITSPLGGEVGLGAFAEPSEGSRAAIASPLSSLAQGRGSPSPANGDGSNLADLAERAARLCKADLVSATVGEFPEVQGIAGAYLARIAGEPESIAAAIRDHYKPAGQTDDVPTEPVSVAVALADKLDTLCAFFDIKEYPTGSRDPFALRRAALGILRLVAGRRLRIGAAVEAWLGQDDPRLELSVKDLDRRSLMEIVTIFLLDRLEVQQRDAGIRHDYVAASTHWSSASDSRMDRVVARAAALQSFITTDDGTNLLAGYKRAANILAIEATKDDPNPAHPRCGAPAPAEAALTAALDTALPAAATAVAAEDFAAAMTALASLRAPVDTFFDQVMVNDPDPAVRRYRLALLARFRDAVHQVADFSKIEG